MGPEEGTGSIITMAGECPVFLNQPLRHRMYRNESDLVVLTLDAC